MRDLTDFLGTWGLQRDIQHQGGGSAAFVGQAEWIAQDDGALYIERGELQIPGQGAFQSERQYRWGADLRVYFSDGRYFHRVPSEGGESAHWCDPDQYDASYDFENWPQWSCRWQVKGPRKDYVMISRYQPQTTA
ncbi:hypothetical protein TRP8649_03003 [Pelagimonas phthalicica]|uniref:DUF6314 domain-containing protein n=1 Tax=Pelagimonas phthalicica TaxID=1037362 RepID=A0A238JGD4_9RHOB|nr:DUF6314 family protein [Pelagimonas phthalicica]TDS91826.1 hypothetical protein CLV87_3004 [Pelagimonas phthalicica]SMX28876.1 hypothetical protein TRP8649_03003 [Pelagimonas phthalicica]